MPYHPPSQQESKARVLERTYMRGGDQRVNYEHNFRSSTLGIIIISIQKSEKL